MNLRGLEKFTQYLLDRHWTIFGPKKSAASGATPEVSPYLKAHGAIGKLPQIFIGEIAHASQLALDGRLPFYSFKRFFLPERETLFAYQQNRLKEKKETRLLALLGINLLDLKAINLYDQVFEKDSAYQSRRRQMLIVGYSVTPEIEDNIFAYKFEEDILEHLPFDIFLAQTSDQRPTINYKLFTGSLRGQRILEDFGYRNYQHIQFSGPVKEGPLNEHLITLREKLKNYPQPELWKKLGDKCLACGKCTLVCPTCFCFRLDDEPALNNDCGQRCRSWDACFFQEFSEVAGGHKFLPDIASRLHFWYYHKFVRIPDEFDFSGCVGCHRCAKVCPVGIDIAEVLKKIEIS
ncbi:MAG: 4Fe-4S dicluster domain-containing protein [Patescibacteria group bacterium]